MASDTEPKMLSKSNEKEVLSYEQLEYDAVSF